MHQHAKDASYDRRARPSLQSLRVGRRSALGIRPHRPRGGPLLRQSLRGTVEVCFLRERHLGHSFAERFCTMLCTPAGSSLAKRKRVMPHKVPAPPALVSTVQSSTCAQAHVALDPARRVMPTQSTAVAATFATINPTRSRDSSLLVTWPKYIMVEAQAAVAALTLAKLRLHSYYIIRIIFCVFFLTIFL